MENGYGIPNPENMLSFRALVSPGPKPPHFPQTWLAVPNLGSWIFFVFFAWLNDPFSALFWTSTTASGLSSCFHEYTCVFARDHLNTPSPVVLLGKLDSHINLSLMLSLRYLSNLEACYSRLPFILFCLSVYILFTFSI